MRIGRFFNIWGRELSSLLCLAEGNELEKGELAFGRVVGTIIIASERLRWKRKPEPEEISLLEKADTFVANLTWDRTFKRNSMAYTESLFEECKEEISNFDRGLEYLGRSELEEIARSVVLTRDSLSLLAARQISSGIPFPGISSIDRYPFDEKIRCLLPDLDLYLDGWRKTLSVFPGVPWIWKERLECLSSVALSNFFHCTRKERAPLERHLAVCTECTSLVKTAELPKFDRNFLETIAAECPGQDTLRLYRHLQLSDAERRLIDRHLATCRSCRNEVEEKSAGAAENVGWEEIAGYKLQDVFKKTWKAVEEFLISPVPLADAASSTEELVSLADAASSTEELRKRRKERLARQMPKADLWKDDIVHVWVNPVPAGWEIHVRTGKRGRISLIGTDRKGNPFDLEADPFLNETVFLLNTQHQELPVRLNLRIGKYRNSFSLEI